MDHPSNPSERTADQVFSDSSEALAAAKSTLKRRGVDARERSEALLVVGTAAYYDNNIAEAVTLLRQAAELAPDSGLLTQALMALAPAVSKQGNPEEALALLESPSTTLEPGHAGQLCNLRSVILTELGRLTEALSEAEKALELQRLAGDREREARTLVNLGAVSSWMGRLDDAERWLKEARTKTEATGQTVVTAGIEGNLGYVASRRGDFSLALTWYQRARSKFESLGQLDLLVAVLEVDHARTLLDVGLAIDALDAAERAVQSAVAGGNQMLETQAQLLLAEALGRVGEQRAASRAIERSQEMAARLGQVPWELRAAYLASRIDPEIGAQSDDDIAQLLDAGWSKEAMEVAVARALAIREDEPDRVLALLDDVRNRTARLDLDPVDLSLADLVAADTAGDLERGWQAFDRAMAAVAEQRNLLGSIELRAVIVHRLRPLADLGMSLALRSNDPGKVALAVLDRVRATFHAEDNRTAKLDDDDLGRLRDSRVALDIAKLEGKSIAEVEAATATVRRLEREALDRRRTIQPSAGEAPPLADTDSVILPSDTAYVGFAVHKNRTLAVTAIGGTVTATDLGPPSKIRSSVRAQRTALRHLADERRTRISRSLEQLVDASRSIGQTLLAPLPLEEIEHVVITPSGLVDDIAWNSLPQLHSLPVTIAPSLSDWSTGSSRPAIANVGFIGGPGLSGTKSELENIAQLYGRTDAVIPLATCQEAKHLMQQADLLHLAAHGTYRSDNPFFSAFELADGPLSILEIAELPSLPNLVVLAACDAGQSGSTGRSGVPVGTATELRRQGVQVVVAPMTVVNDAAAAEFSLALHRGLTNGKSVDDAMLAARLLAQTSGDPRLLGAASSIHVFGGVSTQSPLIVSP